MVFLNKDGGLKKKNVVVLTFMLILCLTLFSIGTAYEFDNVKSYDSITQTVTITNNFGLGDNIAQITLLTPLSVSVMPGQDRKVAEFEINAMEQYAAVFNQMDFYYKDKDMLNFYRPFTYKFKNKTGTHKVDDYEYVCIDLFEYPNNSIAQDCFNNLTGSHNEDIFKWVELDKSVGLAKGNKTIGIFTNVYQDDYVEWIPVWFGVSIEEFADFTAGLKTGLVSYHSFNYPLLENSKTDQINMSFNLTGDAGGSVSIKPGKDGTALNTSVDMPNHTHYNFTTSFNFPEGYTISFWWQPNGALSSDAGPFTPILSTQGNYAAPYNNLTMLQWNNATGKLGFVLFDSAGIKSITTSTDTIYENTGYRNIVMIINRTHISLYINGTWQFSVDNNASLSTDWNITKHKWSLFKNIFQSNYEAGGGNQSIDEFAVWNRTLSPTEISDLFNNGDGLFYAGAGTVNITVTQMLPLNDLIFNYSNISFSCNITTSVNLNITNSTTKIYDSSIAIAYNTTFININGTYNLTNVTVNFTSDGIYHWWCDAWADDHSNYSKTSNRSFTIDTIFPDLNLTYPFNVTYIINVSILNYTIVDANSQSCWWSNSSGLWNSTAIAAGTNFSGITSIEGNNIWIVYCNDTVNHVNSSNVTFFKDTLVPQVNLTFPLNDTYTTNVSVLNYTLNDSNPQSCWWSNSSGLWNSTVVTPGGTNFSGITSIEGNNVWTIYCNDTLNNINSSSITFFKDTAAPSITVTYPRALEIRTDPQRISFTATDLQLNTCWFLYNYTNTTVACASGVENTLNFTSESDASNMTVFANDTLNTLTSYFIDWDWLIEVEELQYNSTVYETGTYPFKIHIQTDGTLPLPSVILYYNGTAVTTTQSGSDNDMWFNTTHTVPVSLVNQNVSFYWEFDYQGEILNSLVYNHTVKPIDLCFCGSGACGNIPYINFSFMDEQNLTAMNATLPGSNWLYYYLGDGSANKSFTYGNTTQNPNYDFCFYPNDSAVTTTYEIQYAQTGYQQKRYTQEAVTYTNTTTNTLLYLLPNAFGSYTTFQVQQLNSNPIEDVYVTASRQLSGVWTLVESAFTDGGGQVTFWVNPDYNYEFVFTRTGYTTLTHSIRPTQPLYTIIMETETGDADYIGDLTYLIWDMGPVPGYLSSDVNYTFYFNISSNNSDIVSCGFSLADSCNGTATILASTTGCNAEGGYLTISMNSNASTTGIICGSYTVDKGGGSFYVQRGMSWFTLFNYTAAQGTLWTGINRAKDLDIFGTDSNRQMFSKMIFFYLALTIGLGMLTYSTGWDVQTRGSAVILLTLILWMASFPGFLEVETLGRITFFNKFAIALMGTIYSLGYIIGGWLKKR